MTLLRCLSCLLVLALASPTARSAAQEPDPARAAPTSSAPGFQPLLPAGARLTESLSEDPGSARFALGPWQGGAIPTALAEGAYLRRAFAFPAAGVTTQQIVQDLRDQLIRQGYQIAFSCETRACGGYDFRYGADLSPEPALHIDLSDFRYLLAQRPSPRSPETPAQLALWVSRSTETGFVQLIEITESQAAPLALAPPGPLEPLPDPIDRATPPADPAWAGSALGQAPPAGGAATDGGAETPPQTPPPMPPEMPPEMPPQAADLARALEDKGAVALDDLVFDSGAASLAAGAYPSLAALAAYLQAHPDHELLLVGHSDATGGLAANIALSRQRAQAVRARLIADHGLAPGRITAEGAGFLAPRASNLDESGRAANRRVEAVLVDRP